MNVPYPQIAGREVALEPLATPPTYSICTLVTRPLEYQQMYDGFVNHGFSPEDTEYLWVDNSVHSKMDAYAAYNAFLIQAKSPYIILCHQDIQLLQDDRKRLDQIISELNRLDPHWGLFGNSGPRLDGIFAARITDPHVPDRTLGGPLPARVVNLDENFIVVRRSANLALSHNLCGFHLYGPDLCLVAEILGVHAYVVDFHLHHKSGGCHSKSYYQSRTAFRKKYDRVFRPRWIQIPTLRPVFLSGIPALSEVALALRKVGFWPRMSGYWAFGNRGLKGVQCRLRNLLRRVSSLYQKRGHWNRVREQE
jgi:hypothetical protein